MSKPRRAAVQIQYLPETAIDKGAICCDERCPIIELHAAHIVAPRRGPKIRSWRRS